MRRLTIFFLLLALIVSLSVSVCAQTQANSISTYATVSSNESCEVTMTVVFHLDDPLAELTFPVPAKASNVTLNGSRVATSRSGQVRYIDLTKLTGGLPGDFTAVITFHLKDVVSYNDAGLLVMQVPLLSGFAYPVMQLDGSVMLPGEVVTKPSFSSGYHNANIEQDLTFSVAGATITCQSTKELKDKETLTMSLNVTDAMFPQSVIRLVNLTPLYIIMGVCAAIALAYWILFLRNFPPRFPPCATPPAGYSAGQLGSILSLKGADLTLMVFTWAQLGYVLIQLDKRDRVLLHKRMEMGNERSGFEQKCFRLLFANRDLVDATSLRYATVSQKVAKLKPNVQNFVHAKSGSLLPFRIFLAIVGAFDGICLGLTLAGEAAAPWLLGILFGLIFLLVSWKIQEWAACLVSGRMDKLYIALALCVVWLVLTLFAGTAALDIWVLLGQFLAGLMVTFGGRRTPEGKQACAEALGLLRYLRGLSDMELAYIVNHNPDYFYDMVPYAIALGVDKAFAAHFGNTLLNACPYLQVPMSGRMSAMQWNNLLQRTMKNMDAQQQRQSTNNFLRLLRSFIR